MIRWLENSSHQKRRLYLLAFALPFMVCTVICMAKAVYPFGSNCILHMDMYHQYCPFFMEFQEKLKQGQSLMYSWNLGMGSDFVSLYAYYLASPFNLLLLICSKEHVIEFMTLLILVKIGLCSLTFFYYLKAHYHMEGKDGRLHANQVIPALVFSTAYALSGFVAAYSWDIMWLDVVSLFPLIMAGLEKLVLEKKPVLYFLTLALAIYSNYYISIMVCIFLLFYFLLLFAQKKEGRISAALQFFWYSLLAGGSSAVLLIPEIIALKASGSVGSGFPKELDWYFPISSEFGRMAVTAETYMGDDHWPNLYAGAFTLVLLGLYIMNRRISWKDKGPRLCMLVFFMVSFANNQLDYIWHGMHFPQGLPGRESFLFIFLLLAMGFEEARKWKGTKSLHILVAVVAVLGLLLAGGMNGSREVTAPISLVITALFVCVYGIVMLLLKLSDRGKLRNFLSVFAVCTALLELAVNMGTTGLQVTSRTAYMDKQEAYRELLDRAKEDDRKTDNTFYRVEDTGRKTKNDSAMYGYPAVTVFSSLIHLKVSQLFQYMYMEGGTNFYCYNGANPLSSAMLSVRYMLSSNPSDESPLRTLVGSSGGNYLYRNRYWLPLGFMMDENAIRSWNPSLEDRAGSLNSLASALGAEGEMIYPLSCTADERAGNTTITVPEDGYYYAGYVNCSSDSLTVSRSDGWTQQYSKTSHRYLIDLGECKAGTQIDISNMNAETISYRVFRLNFHALDTAMETLGRQTMELTGITDRSIDGTIEVRHEGRLILPVPADKGWKLYVDGKETPINPFKDALLAVHLQEGTHRVRFVYTTPGLSVGAAVSLGALGLFLLSMFLRGMNQLRIRYVQKKD